MSGRDGLRTAIFGKSGSGKSVFVERMLAEHDRVIVFDPKGDWRTKPGYEQIGHFSRVKQFLLDMGDGAFRAVYTPEAVKKIQRLSTLSAMLQSWNRYHLEGPLTRPVLLVAEELGGCFPIGLPDPTRNGGFAGLCQMGRAYGVSIAGIAQRPAAVNAEFRGNLDRIVAFKFSFPNDTAAVADAMESAAVPDMMARLEPYQFILKKGVEEPAIHGPLKL